MPAMRHESDPKGRDDARAPARRSILAAIVGALSISLAGCAEPLLGNMWSYGGEIGDWNTTVNYCYTTAHQGTVGSTSLISFAHRTGNFPLMQLNVGSVSGRPTLVTVQTSDPSREIQLHREDCKQFDMRQHRNTDGSIGADVQLDCETGDGWRFTASIHVESCRGSE